LTVFGSLHSGFEVTMTQNEYQQIAKPTANRWKQISILSALVGGVLMALTGVALLSVLNEAEFVIVEPLGAVAMILLALALPALYTNERHWFGRLGKIGFGLVSVGWVAGTVGLIVTSLTMPPVSEFGFLAFLLGLLVAMIGALVFGVAMLRTDAKTAPRPGAWLLVAALPVGLPFAIGFTTYVMGEGADPWAGPMLLYGLAWIVFGRYLWGRQTEITNSVVTAR
jgi:tryptophan-rich sensory protein